MVLQDKELKEKALNAVEKNKDVVAGDRFRLTYHLMPPVGLLNDPNGLVYFQGYYHVFYQWNPFETKHGIKYWGHYRSKNLVDWETLPITLAPSDWYDKNGCYSGSAVVHDGKLFLFYTGNVRDAEGERETYQCLAVSNDGVHFEKKGPVIHLPEGYTAHFRDPKVWEESGRWYMVIGAQTVKEEGVIVLFSSDDLETWEHHGILAGSNRNGLADFGYMWECPDLFTLNGKDVLVFSPQGLEAEGIKYNNIYQTGYLVGDFDRENNNFTHGEFDELDRGFDFYAPQTLVDDNNRRILYGWMGLPDETEAVHPTRKHQWIHALTIPRELELVEEKLYQKPVEELKQLRGDHVVFDDVDIKDQSIKLPKVEGKTVELAVSVNKSNADVFTLEFGSVAKLSFNQTLQLVTLERKTIKGDGVHSRSCRLNQLSNLRIFLDKSSIEVFLNDGAEVFTARLFDYDNDPTIQFSAKGTINIKVEKWELILGVRHHKKTKRVFFHEQRTGVDFV
ncbi:glycoside hydrolase family 32 protein [Aquibacillus salsiterrae]|uniref:Sucrose-6-phosphate hydrolase n=1 Tax=Aquibacillus salsiterrae TaxID=2950439 RepID=A0A9X3WHJ2_9BACI|nr:sucrose-6-phosphate hydrolase [Aquibacillus salsiterrae]MDC3417544.1 sucrose-6-phosphate hydrolase [Aquibacillus salsiterrae]